MTFDFSSCLFLPINPVGMGLGGRIGMKKKYIVGLRAEEGSILEARLTRIACSTPPEGYIQMDVENARRRSGGPRSARCD